MIEARPEVFVIDAIDPPPLERQPRKRRVPRWPARSIGLAATVAIHISLCSPLILGGAAQKKQTRDGIGITAWASQGEHVEAMVLLDLSSMSTDSDMDPPMLESTEDSIAIEDEDLRLVSTFAEPSPQILFEEEVEEAEEATEAAGDPRGQAEMFGKYMGHVAARIDRAWMRPRTPVDGGRFECRARVVQNRQGMVLSVNLDNCGGDAKWRDSLSSAILRASPLSAPPEPSLFTESITLQLAGEQYEAGRTPEYLYEPVPVQLALKQPARAALQAPAAADGAAHIPATTPATLPASGDVELTITGSKVEWKKR